METHARSLDIQIEELVACREAIRDKIASYRRALAVQDVTAIPAATDDAGT
jgi:hypothetical protein